MSLPAMQPDRRRLPRTNLECLAYINFEPNNGGIILNICEDGLCFHAVAPVETNTNACFWFSAESTRIAAEGLVVWVDTSRKTGGLRFNHLSQDARRQIRVWMDPSSKPLARPKEAVVPVPSSRSALLVVRRANAAGSAALRSFWDWIRTLRRWSEFSRGLVTGLLIAVFLATLLSLHARQRIGDALIWLGERFETTPQPRVASLPPRVSTPRTPELTVQAKVPVHLAPAPPVSATSPRRAEKRPLPALTSLAPRRHSKLAPPTFPAPTFRPIPSASLPLPSITPPSVLAPPETAHLASPEKVLAAKAIDRSDENENTEDVLEIDSATPLGKYFEVGKFKDQLAAGQMRHDLGKLGFRTVVLPKSLLWLKSYQVLVGPYLNDQDAQGARRDLQSAGFKPRSLGQHSRQLSLLAPGANPDAGAAERDDFIVTWEPYGAEATVKLVEAGQTSRTATAKWTKLPGPSDYTAIVYTTGTTGTRILLSIQFRGMSRAVTLSDDRRIVF